MNKHEEVIAFINKFTNNGKRQEVIECFTCGCCYWFAHILFERFYAVMDWSDVMDWNPDVDIMYDEVANHFGCRVKGRVYDITGDVTEQYRWEPSYKVAQRDELLWDRIVRDCIEMRDGSE